MIGEDARFSVLSDRAMMGLQYSIHHPSPFIRQYQAELLPAWDMPAASLLILLHPCPVSLQARTIASERHKKRLRNRSIYLAQALIDALQENGHSAELFDPMTGQPHQSHPGQLTLDDVQVVRAVLGYPLVPNGACHLIEHPAWGCDVYPAVVLSTASPEELTPIAHRVLAKN